MDKSIYLDPERRESILGAIAERMAEAIIANVRLVDSDVMMKSIERIVAEYGFKIEKPDQFVVFLESLKRQLNVHN